MNNSIGPTVKGVKEGINLAIPKCAIKKLANIFGLEVNNILPKIDDNFSQKFFEIEEEQNNIYYGQLELITKHYKKVYIRYSSIYKGSSLTTGYYFPFESCESLIDELYLYFKEKVATLSGSILEAVEYLEWKSKNN